MVQGKRKMKKEEEDEKGQRRRPGVIALRP
jgi:hypothetical protein